MVKKTLNRLLRAAGDAIASEQPDRARLAEAFGAPVASLLGEVLELRNGFYAFESALHVFSDRSAGNERGLVEWNARELWRGDYDGLADGAVYFAEDVFGTQFCARENAIYTFDPETGEFEAMAGSLEEWASEILDDYESLTGSPLAHEWQVAHGPIPIGSRLVPMRPFVLGGEYEVENLRAMDAVKSMKFCASIAVQIRDLPDGAAVELRLVD
jgi:hypothetical protein